MGEFEINVEVVYKHKTTEPFIRGYLKSLSDVLERDYGDFIDVEKSEIKGNSANLILVFWTSLGEEDSLEYVNGYMEAIANILELNYGEHIEIKAVDVKKV